MDNVVCRFYVSSTGCKFGKRCIFPHLKSKYRKPDTICRFFVAGKCAFGSLCWHDHEFLLNNPAYGFFSTWGNNHVTENNEDGNCSPISSGLINEELASSNTILKSIHQNGFGDTSLSSSCEQTNFCFNQYTLKYISFEYDEDENLQLQNVYIPPLEPSYENLETVIYYCDDETEDQANNVTFEAETASEPYDRLNLFKDLHISNNGDACSEAVNYKLLNEVRFDADSSLQCSFNFSETQLWDPHMEVESLNVDENPKCNLNIIPNCIYDRNNFSTYMEHNKCGCNGESRSYELRCENEDTECSGSICLEDNPFSSRYTNLTEESYRFESSPTFYFRQRKRNYRQRSKAAGKHSITYKEKSNSKVAWYNRNRKNLKKTHFENHFNQLKSINRGSRSFCRRRQVDSMWNKECNESGHGRTLQCMRDSNIDKGNLPFSINKRNRFKDNARFYSPSNCLSEAENIDTNSISSGIESLDLTEENISDEQENEEFEYVFSGQNGKKCFLCTESIMEKDKKDRMFGILENCSHVFCLKCIFWWRSTQNSSRNSSSVSVSCPACKILSKFIIPSKAWISSLKKKNEVIGRYRMTLNRVYCRHYKGGKGNCFYGNSCLYMHALPETKVRDP